MQNINTNIKNKESNRDGQFSIQFLQSHSALPIDGAIKIIDNLLELCLLVFLFYQLRFAYINVQFMHPRHDCFAFCLMHLHLCIIHDKEIQSLVARTCRLGMLGGVGGGEELLECVELGHRSNKKKLLYVISFNLLQIYMLLFVVWPFFFRDKRSSCLQYLTINNEVCIVIFFNMNFNEQQRRICLLNEYAQCLQKQNNAKSIEISILHQQLSKVETENRFLRSQLDAVKVQQTNIQYMNQQLPFHKITQNQPSNHFNDVHAQTDIQTEQCPNQNNLVFSLSSTIKEKDDIIAKYHKECQEMFQAIQKLQSSNKVFQDHIAKDKDIISKLEQRLRKQEQKRHTAQERLQNISYDIYSAGEQAQNYKRRAVTLEKDNEELICENNALIERVRALERQKNEYYHQIKRMSRVSFGGEGLGKSSVKKSRKVSDQRFKEIEQHLRRVQIQNQAIQSNLMIK